MQAKRLRVLALLAFCVPLLAMAPVAIAREASTPEATQTAFTTCDSEIEIEGDARPYPDGIRLTGGCVTFEQDLQQYTITARYIIEPNTTLNDANTEIGSQPSDELALTGQTSIVVEEGSLTVTVTQMCVPRSEGNCGTPGAAFVGRKSADGGIQWASFGVDDPVTLNSGDEVYLQDVIATFSSGDQGAVVATFGVFSSAPGQGCPTACFRMP